MAALTIFTALSFLPMEKTGKSDFSPNTCSCSMAAGLYTSVAIKSGECPFFLKYLANFTAVVVLPVPCNPTNIIIVGGAGLIPVSYTHLRAHETDSYLVCRLL